MTTPAKDSSKAGAVLAAMAVMGAVALGTLALRGSGGPGPDEHGNPRYRRVATTPDGGVPAGAVCVSRLYVAPPTFLRAHSLDDRRGTDYLRCRICALPADGGSTEIPGGLIPVGEAVEEAYDGGDGVQCALSGEPEHPRACARADADGGRVTPSTCEGRPRLNDGGTGLWEPAPLRVDMGPGTQWEWRGDCFRKPEHELGGISAWPAECGPESMP